ncbi:class I SAM-dependent methyltransferase [Phytoactinopolyspora halotolerans]|uniref:class I SAM-dependent methyltransferase n=1 Tax=Phytoactinopolyspora halotolerans TaxID=1981512 RepID=UPI001C209D3B|nr:class I SAM-dependent methyltransferase [Phytoactinopolyspora halotolerans]
MTGSAGPVRFGHLEFNSPIATWRVERLVRELAGADPRMVVDFGCGLGALLRRIASAAPQARCLGVDIDAELLESARKTTADTGLDDRVSFVEGDASGWEGPAPDLAVCIGASHAWGSTDAALSALAGLVEPGGWVLFADGFWERPPTDAELASMWEGTSADDWHDLAGLTDSAIAAGLRPMRVEAVERSEWDDFESGFLADMESWLVEHPGDPRADEIRARADAHRGYWLRGHRGLLGFAYLTLRRPVMSREIHGTPSPHAVPLG